jgi:hypothetical protein
MIPPVLQTIHQVNTIRVIFFMVPENLIKWFQGGKGNHLLADLTLLDSSLSTPFFAAAGGISKPGILD